MEGREDDAHLITKIENAIKWIKSHHEISRVLSGSTTDQIMPSACAFEVMVQGLTLPYTAIPWWENPFLTGPALAQFSSMFDQRQMVIDQWLSLTTMRNHWRTVIYRVASKILQWY